MNIAQLKHKVKIDRKRKKVVGRGTGAGHGKTCTRGHKGQKARSGVSFSPLFEGGQTPLVRKIPKRGFSNFDFQYEIAIVNIDQLNRFNDGEQVDPTRLIERKLVRGRFDRIKILGRGALTKKKLTVTAHLFSKGAAKKITDAQGQAVTIKQILKKNQNNKATPPRKEK
ncbi:MAG: 50S ribosomal protein L15 [Planctomycetes bacterium]|nr:50S ribosomal protein L15 [Planctomycetota bacterium]